MPTSEEMENNQYNPVWAVKTAKKNDLLKAVDIRDWLKTLEDLERVRKNKSLGNNLVI